MSPEGKKWLNGWGQAVVMALTAGLGSLGGWIYLEGLKDQQIKQNQNRIAEVKQAHNSDMKEMKEILQDIRDKVGQLAEDSAYERGLRDQEGN